MASSAELYDEGLVAFRRGDTGESRRLNEEALAVARAAGLARDEGRALVGLCRLAFRAGDAHEGRRLASEARRVADRVGDDDTAGVAIHLLAEIARGQRDYASAVSLYEEHIVRRRAASDTGWVTMETFNLGAALAQGPDPARGAALIRDATSRARDEGDDGLLGYCVLGAACAAAALGEVAQAAELLGAADAEFERRSEVLDPAEAAERASVFERIGAEHPRYRAGRALPLDAAVERVVSTR